MQNNSVNEPSVVADGVTGQQARPTAWLLAGAGAFIPLIAFAWALLTAGSGEQNYSVRDSFFWLNTAWRILHGQIPHADFSLTTGTLLGYLTALGILARGPCVGSIAAGQALLGLALGILSFALLRRRTSPWLAAIGTVFCALLVMATRQAGEHFDVRSHAFLYNRIAEGFLAPLFWILFLPPLRPRPMLDFAEQVLAGGFIVLLALTKFSYALAGGALIAAAIFPGRIPVRNLLGLIGGGVAAFAGATIGMGLNPAAWFVDITRPFRTGYGETQLIRLVASTIKGLPSFLVLAAIFLLIHRRLSKEKLKPLLFLLAAVWALAIGSMVASQQRQEYLLPISATLLLLEIARRAALPVRSRRLAFGVALIVIAPHLLKDASSVFSSWRSAQTEPFAATYIHAPGLTDFRLGANQAGFADELNEGLALVREHTPDKARVMAFDYSDPVAFALHRPPPKGGAVFWYPKFSFSPKAYPDPALVFRDKPWILLTRREPDMDFFTEIYGANLTAMYRVAAKSKNFDLLEPISAQE